MYDPPGGAIPPPGFMPMVVISPEQYANFMSKKGASKWPVYFAARMAAQTIQDLGMKALQVDDIDLIKKNISGFLTTGLGAADAAKKGGDTGDIANLKETIEKLYGGLYDNWKAGIWKGVGAAYSSAMDNFMNVGQLVYAYKTLAYHTAITPRMRRWWNKIYTPTIPDTATAYNLMLRGKITDKQFDTYASYDGWDKKNVGLIKEAWKTIPNTRAAFQLQARGVIDWKEYIALLKANAWPDGWEKKIYQLFEALPSPREAFHLWTKKLIDTKERDGLYHAAGIDPGRYEIITTNLKKVPTAKEAFYLWTKGLLDKTQRDGIYQWNAYDPAWNEIITANWHYVPTIYDLLRIADSVELDQIWALDVMKRRGVLDKDKAKIWEMLQMRPLREEVRELTKAWTIRMKFGRATLEELEEEFISLGIKTKERELLLKKAQMDYEDELITEYVEVLTWKFRTAIISADTFLASLISTGIREEKANLIVELQQAMGYYGYY
ncbi:hypothetical protein ES703_60534 [subsurface metagenome]